LKSIEKKICFNIIMVREKISFLIIFKALEFYIKYKGKKILFCLLKKKKEREIFI
jgi:hypothetical protein